ncbi:nitrilase-related carbon-nitrogen hydrolase [Paratractidigestivibacter sp.]|uniref:nitrilase-related carbon-nitrogen hydrolase n=1 Tax=Paratractidigestivibacter sp. TaxID=2847316 RepID=UPI002ACB0EB5|nr:nitrilase-related carbon-nitrogen hydrolase [Paratractidigestivibacter sp.]
MKIAVAQIRSFMGDLDAARARIASLSVDAVRDGADLLVLPSCALCSPEPLAGGDREGFFADELACVSKLADEVACPTLLPVVLPASLDGAMEVVFLKEGRAVPLRLLGKMRAMALSSEGTDLPDDGAHPSLTQPLLEVCGAKIGVALTYEELDDYVAYEYPIDAVLFCSTYGFGLDDEASSLGASVAESRFKADADAMGAWVIGAGGVGFCGSEVYPGASFALAPWGELAAAAPVLEEALMVVDVDPGDEGPLKNPLAMPVFDPAVTAWGALCEGLAGIVGSLGATDVSIVVDGRLSPMLACVVAVDALGPTHVHPTILAWGDKATDEASRRLVKNLRLCADELEAAALGADGDPELARDLAWARVGAEARRNSHVLLGPADKTAIALGSAPARDLTGVLPFGDIYRSDVLALSRLRNTISPVIPASARASFDVEEVARGVRGTDEQRVETLDFILSGYIEWERPLTEVAVECGDAELGRNVVAQARDAMSRLSGSVLAPTMSSKTVAEARGPLGLKWRDRVRSSDEELDLEAVIRRVAKAMASEAAEGGDKDGATGGHDVGRERAQEAIDLLSMLGGEGDGAGLGGLFGDEGESPRDGADDGSRRDAGPFWEGWLFSDN